MERPSPTPVFFVVTNGIENFFAQFFGNAGAAVGQAEFHSFPIILRSGLNLDPQRAAVVFSCMAS